MGVCEVYKPGFLLYCHQLSHPWGLSPIMKGVLKQNPIRKEVDTIWKTTCLKKSLRQELSLPQYGKIRQQAKHLEKSLHIALFLCNGCIKIRMEAGNQPIP